MGQEVCVALCVDCITDRISTNFLIYSTNCRVSNWNVSCQTLTSFAFGNHKYYKSSLIMNLIAESYNMDDLQGKKKEMNFPIKIDRGRRTLHYIFFSSPFGGCLKFL